MRGLIERGCILFCLGISLLCVSACSDEKPPLKAVKANLPEQERKPLRPLRWMGHWQGEGRREALVKRVLADFSYTHQDIEVFFRFASEVLPKKNQVEAGKYIAEMIRSGDLQWDVIWLDPWIYWQVAEELDDWEWGRRHLVDFSEIEEVAAYNKESLQGERAHQHTAGLFVGPYIEGFYYTMWYNRELAARLGIKLREDGMTEEELLDYASRIEEYNQSTDQESVSLLLDYGLAGGVKRLFISLWSSDIAEGLEARDESKVAALDRTLALFSALKSRCSSLVRVENSWEESAQALIDGKVLFFCDATWRYNAFEQFNPEGLKQLGLAPVPGYHDKPRSVIGGYISTWAVLKNAAGRDEGVELMKYWSRPVIAAQWIKNTKSPTGLIESLYDPTFGRDSFAEYQRSIGRIPFNMVRDSLMLVNHLEDDQDWGWSKAEAVIADLREVPYPTGE